MFNLTTFRELVIAALWTGLLAGLLLTAVQQIQVIPTLLQAEVYEENAAAASFQCGKRPNIMNGS
jgi:predicted cobalt transporter CbtA